MSYKERKWQACYTKTLKLHIFKIFMLENSRHLWFTKHCTEQYSWPPFCDWQQNKTNKMTTVPTSPRKKNQDQEGRAITLFRVMEERWGMPDSEPVPRGATFFCFPLFACLGIGFQLSNFSFTKFQLWLLYLQSAHMFNIYSASASWPHCCRLASVSLSLSPRLGLCLCLSLLTLLSLIRCTMSRAPLGESLVMWLPARRKRTKSPGDGLCAKRFLI